MEQNPFMQSGGPIGNPRQRNPFRQQSAPQPNQFGGRRGPQQGQSGQGFQSAPQWTPPSVNMPMSQQHSPWLGGQQEMQSRYGAPQNFQQPQFGPQQNQFMQQPMQHQNPFMQHPLQHLNPFMQGPVSEMRMQDPHQKGPQQMPNAQGMPPQTPAQSVPRQMVGNPFMNQFSGMRMQHPQFGQFSLR